MGLFKTKSVALAILAAFVVFIACGKPTELSMQVTQVDATVSSFPLLGEGKRMETGPITVKSTDPGKTGISLAPATKLDLKTGKGEIVWPVEISCALLDSTMGGKISTAFVGTMTVLAGDTVTCIDAAHVNLSSIGIGRIIIININDIKPWPTPWIRLLDDTTVLKAEFSETPIEYFRKNELPFVGEELQKALKMLSQATGEDVSVPIDRVIKIYAGMETFHELLIYFPELDSFQTADLKGTFQLKTIPVKKR